MEGMEGAEKVRKLRSRLLRDIILLSTFSSNLWTQQTNFTPPPPPTQNKGPLLLFEVLQKNVLFANFPFLELQARVVTTIFSETQNQTICFRSNATLKLCVNSNKRLILQ